MGRSRELKKREVKSCWSKKKKTIRKERRMQKREMEGEGKWKEKNKKKS